MLPPAPYFFVRPDERELLRLRAECGYAISFFLGSAGPLTVVFALFLVVANLGNLVPRPYLLAAGGLYVLLLPVLAFVGARRAATSEYVVTDARVYARRGRLATKVHFTTHDRVTDMLYRQGPADRWLGMSHLTLTTGGGDVRIAGVADALAVKSVVEDARARWIERLLSEAGIAQARAPAEPAPPAATQVAAPLPELVAATTPIGPRPAYVPPSDRILWTGKPRIAAVLARWGPPFGAVLAFGFFSSAWRDSPGGLLVTIPLVLVLFVAGVVALLAERRTEFTITSWGVYERRGLVSTRIATVAHEKITDVAYEEDLAGRLLGFATIRLDSAGGRGPPVTLRGIADAQQVKRILESARAPRPAGGAP